MGQASSTEGDAQAFDQLSADEYQHQVVSEYARLRGEKPASSGVQTQHRSSGSGSSTSADGGLDQKFISATMHSVERLLRPLLDGNPTSKPPDGEPDEHRQSSTSVDRLGIVGCCGTRKPRVHELHSDGGSSSMSPSVHGKQPTAPPNAIAAPASAKRQRVAEAQLRRWPSHAYEGGATAADLYAPPPTAHVPSTPPSAAATDASPMTINHGLVNALVAGAHGYSDDRDDGLGCGPASESVNRRSTRDSLLELNVSMDSALTAMYEDPTMTLPPAAAFGKGLHLTSQPKHVCPEKEAKPSAVPSASASAAAVYGAGSSGSRSPMGMHACLPCMPSVNGMASLKQAPMHSGQLPHVGPPGQLPHVGPPGQLPHVGPPGQLPHVGPPGQLPHVGLPGQPSPRGYGAPVFNTTRMPPPPLAYSSHQYSAPYSAQYSAAHYSVRHQGTIPTFNTALNTALKTAPPQPPQPPPQPQPQPPPHSTSPLPPPPLPTPPFFTPDDMLFASERVAGNIPASERHTERLHLQGLCLEMPHTTLNTTLNTTLIHAAAMRTCASRTDQAQRLTWSAAEDTLILQSVEKMGQRWRKIAVLMPNRSDDAVRNRWHRLMNSPMHGGLGPMHGGLGVDSITTERTTDFGRVVVYRCARNAANPRSARGMHVLTTTLSLSTGARDAASPRGGTSARRRRPTPKRRLSWRRPNQAPKGRWSVVVGSASRPTAMPSAAASKGVTVGRAKRTRRS